MKAMKKMMALVLAMILCACMLATLTASALEVSDGAGEGDVVDWNDLFGEDAGDANGDADATTAAADTTSGKAEEKKGCGSFVGASAWCILAGVGASAVCLCKKENG